MPLRQIATGQLGTVAEFVRSGGRCPARDFLDRCQKPMKGKFRDAFVAIVRMGARYVIHERFTSLHGEGKPLWEFKEHHHRLYCAREQVGLESVRVILLYGWKKQKEGKSKEENQEIQKALNLYIEFQKEERIIGTEELWRRLGS